MNFNYQYLHLNRPSTHSHNLVCKIEFDFQTKSKCRHQKNGSIRFHEILELGANGKRLAEGFHLITSDMRTCRAKEIKHYSTGKNPRETERLIKWVQWVYTDQRFLWILVHNLIITNYPLEQDSINFVLKKIKFLNFFIHKNVNRFLKDLPDKEAVVGFTVGHVWQHTTK